MQHILSDNEKAWDAVADQFLTAAVLPVWGPFGVGDDLGLLPEIKDSVFLEVGCGSGRSIKYLVDNGANKVYGLDISDVQIKEAEHFNEEAIENGVVELIKGNMEDPLVIEPVDVVCSVYALGWTVDPATTLKNMYSYLKPGGMFVWSWDHALFSDVQYGDGNYEVVHSYHEEKPIVLNNWKQKHGVTAHITYYKTSTWFKLLKDAGFEVIGYYEPEPKNMEFGSEDLAKYYSIEKAKKVPATFIFVCKKN